MGASSKRGPASVPAQPTLVIHVRDMQPGDVYIGRANARRGLEQSPWANPFKIGTDGDRDSVIALYRRLISEGTVYRAMLPELRGRRLACWCAPQACHGDVLAELADAL